VADRGRHGLCKSLDASYNVAGLESMSLPSHCASAGVGPERTADIANNVERFVREIVVPHERDPRRDHHGAPTDELVFELRAMARAAGVLTPHILPDGTHLSQRETAIVLRRSGLSPLGPPALNTAAPDEGNMYLLGKVGSAMIKERFLNPVVEGRTRSAFFMTEPWTEGGAGSDPSMMKTTCHRDGDDWIVNGCKCFITGAEGAGVGIVMAKSSDGSCMFLVDLPNPAIRIEHVPNTIDNSMPGGHATVVIDNLRVPQENMLGRSGEGFSYAQIRLSPARLSHCMRWLGTCTRAQEIATAYAWSPPLPTGVTTLPSASNVVSRLPSLFSRTSTKSASLAPRAEPASTIRPSLCNASSPASASREPSEITALPSPSNVVSSAPLRS